MKIGVTGGKFKKIVKGSIITCFYNDVTVSKVFGFDFTFLKGKKWAHTVNPMS